LQPRPYNLPAPKPGQILGTPLFKTETTLWSQPEKKQEANFPYPLWMQKPVGDLRYLNVGQPITSMIPNFEMPVIKVNHFENPSPLGPGHLQMYNIYDIILPNKDTKFTVASTNERLKSHEFIRNILIEYGDGEDISLETCKGKRNLFSYIKILEIVKNDKSLINDNPYRGMPFGVLFYQCCFPITMNQISRTTMCAKSSLKINMRIYALNVAEYCSFHLNQPIYKQYDIWREVIYYEYVRDQIIRKKQSPNFIMLHAFFLSHNRTVDYFKIKKQSLTQRDLMVLENKKHQKLEKLYELGMPASCLGKKVITDKSQTVTQVILQGHTSAAIQKLPDEVNPELRKYSGNVLVLITEAANQNLYQWSSNIFKTEGYVHKMISNGMHDEDVWYGVLFQIISALYVMQLHGIYIREMTIEDNIYISDLGSSKGYWKWIINGITYYVPNKSYVVQIDSNFKDIIYDARITPKTTREYKISGCAISEPCDKTATHDLIYENLKRIISSNSFTTNDHIKNKLCKPPIAVLDFMNRISSDTSTKDIGKLIHNHFTMFLNNRIGTFLKKDSEIPNLRSIEGNIILGQLYAQLIDADTYIWVMPMEENIPPDDTIKVLFKDKPESNIISTKYVPKTNLKSYPFNSMSIEQNIIEGNKLTEDKLLEVYMINSQDYQ
nr:hypothetical protein [Nitrosopumilus sp.]